MKKNVLLLWATRGATTTAATASSVVVVVDAAAARRRAHSSITSGYGGGGGSGTATDVRDAVLLSARRHLPAVVLSNGDGDACSSETFTLDVPSSSSPSSDINNSTSSLLEASQLWVDGLLALLLELQQQNSTADSTSAGGVDDDGDGVGGDTDCDDDELQEHACATLTSCPAIVPRNDRPGNGGNNTGWTVYTL